MAAPLCGVFVQPLMGLLSDRSQFSWGRRRPFIVAGTIGAVISMLTLAWIEDLVHYLGPLLSIQQKNSETSSIIVSAVMLVYCLNIAIQPVQMGLRVLIVENCPKNQQTQASAWATYATSCGNILGYICGSITLPKLFHLSRITQFQSLCVIASLSLTLTVIIGCIFISEQDPRLLLLGRAMTPAPALSMKRIIRAAHTMPLKIRKVCQIQFFAWMAWFPFLYYSATYVGELCRSIHNEMTGSVLTSLDSAPILAREPTMGIRQSTVLRKEAVHTGSLSSLLFATMTFLANIVLYSVLRRSTSSSPRKSRRSSNPLPSEFNFRISRAWMWAHIYFATSMLATVFVTSWVGGAVLVAYVGISWAMTLWAPFSIIGEEMAAASRVDDTEDQIGVVMSLHNVAISAPQVIAAVVSSGIFRAARELGVKDSTGIVLRIGGFAALGAAYLTWKLED